MRVAAIVLVLCVVAVMTAGAQVTVVRQGEENAFITIAKSTAWGGLGGLVLGGAVALIADENQDDILKWFFVGGVCGGLGYGIYHVATRDHPSSALLRIDQDGVDWNIPVVAFRPVVNAESRNHEAGVTLLHVSF